MQKLVSGNDLSSVSGDREGGGEKQRAVKRKRRREVQVGSWPVISALLRARMDCRAGKQELQWPWPAETIH